MTLRRVGVCLLAGLTVSFAVNAGAATFDVTVSPTNGQTVTGWGGFPDTCFGTDPVAPLFYDAIYNELGVTFNRMRLWAECCSDAQGTLVTGAENERTLNHIAYILGEARKRGVTDWYLCPWGAPTPMCVASTQPNARPSTKLDSKYDAQYAKWIVDSINYLVNAKGLPLPKGVCPFNEPSSIRRYSAEQVAHVTKLLKETLRNYPAENLRTIPLVLNDNDSYQNFTYKNSSALDAAYWDSIDVMSIHSYYWGPKSNCKAGDLDVFVNACQKYGPNKPRWQTENCPNVNKGATPWMNQPNQIGHAVSMTQQLCADMSYAGFNVWMWWSIWDPKGFSINAANTDCLLDGDGVKTLSRSKTYFILKKIWNSAKVGSVVHKVTSTDPAFKNGNAFFADGVAFVHNGSTIVVLNNDSDKDAKSYNVKGLTGASADIWQTTASKTPYVVHHILPPGAEVPPGDVSQPNTPSFTDPNRNQGIYETVVPADQDMALVASPAVEAGAISNIALPPLSVTVIITK